MRLLALDLGPDLRGGQGQTALLLQALAGRGHVIRFVGRRGAPLPEILRGHGAIDVVEAPAGPEASPGLLLTVARAARLFRPDVVYAGDSRGHGAAVWSRASASRPLVVHRRVDFHPSGHPLSRAKYRAADLFLAVSKAVEATLIDAGVDAGRIVVVLDGLPPGAFIEAPVQPAPPFRLVHLGAFDGRKGQRVALEAFALLVKGGLDATLLFLGIGRDQPAVAARAAELGVAERCNFAGQVENVAERLAASHLLLLPTDSEGAPLSLAEAMAAGCPVVAHDVGGVSEVALGGVAGVLLPSLDPVAWEAEVRGLLLDPERRARLRDSGRSAAAGRTIAHSVERVEAELLRVLGDTA
ncbi:MAG TPA: glycosyltransferase [Thermoanaerobaculia bacterium]